MFTTGQTFDLIVSAESGVRHPVTVVRATPRLLVIESQHAIYPGTAVCLEGHDKMILGEASGGCPEGSRFHVSVRLDQVLNGLAALASAVEAYSDRPLEPRTDRQVEVRANRQVAA